MIKKIIIAALIIWGAFVFYKKFMADTMESFFNKKVDLFGVKSSVNKEME